MTTEINKAIVHRYVEEGYNAGNMAVIDELFAADFVNHDPAQPAVRDLQGLKQLFMGQRAAFPDVRTTIEDLAAEGDKVVKRFTCRGTQTGEVNGIPATGRHVSGSSSGIFRIAGGRVAENRVVFDALGLLRQLGVIPAATPQ